MTAGEVHRDLQGKEYRRTGRTLYRWLADYDKQGLSGLAPQERPRLQGSRVLDAKLIDFLIRELREDPDASIPELGGDTPAQRWERSQSPLRPIPGEDWLRDCFTYKLERTVSKDNVVRINGDIYEFPRGYASTRVTIYQRVLETNAYEFDHQGTVIRLHPVDLYFNATDRRAPPPSQSEKTAHPRKCSSTMSFERRYGSVLDSSAIDALYELARGNLRATDTLAFKAFCIATQQKDSIVDANHIALARSLVLI